MKNKLSRVSIHTVRLILLLTVCTIGWHGQLAARPAPAAGIDVKLAPASLTNLEARWTWAVESAAKLKGNGFYIGYSIPRMMRKNSWIGSWRSGGDHISLNEIIYGVKLLYSPYSGGRSVSEAARSALKHAKGLYDHDSGEKVMKEVAFLIRFDGRYKSGTNIFKLCSDGHAGNMAMHLDLEDRYPVLWLGKAEINQSLALLSGFYKKNRREIPSVELKKRLVSAVGMHGPNSQVYRFLKGILTGSDDDEVRERTAFWIGEQKTAEAAKLLLDTAVNDRSQDVREKAVFGISLIPLKVADDGLIYLARKAISKEVRKKAIFWLSQKASKRCAEVLGKLVDEEGDTDIQKSAVFALSQLPDGRGTDALIKIAKTHKSFKVRKKALFWLGQSDDPRALDTIISLIEK